MTSPRPSPVVGGALVLAQGLVHAGLSLWLWSDGHRPTRPPPLGLDEPYLAQALYVAPLYVAAWALASLAAAKVQGRRFHDTAGPVGLATALPALVATLLPDVVVYAWKGFDALGPLFRVAAPLTLVVTVIALAVALRGPRRALAVVAALLAQGVVVAPWVR